MIFSDTEAALFERVPILQDIPLPVLRETLATHSASQCVVLPGETFLAAGTAHPGLHVVVHGSLELFVLTGCGREKVFDFVKIGGTVGEETLFSERPLQYSARSLTHTAVFRLSPEMVAAWVDDYPAFSRKLMQLVAARIDFVVRDMISLCTKRATAHLICYLVCQFACVRGPADDSCFLPLAIPRHKLASRLGMTESHLSRTFRDLEEKALLIPRGRGYDVPSISALSNYVCPGGCDF